MKAILVMEMPDNCIVCTCSDDCTDICNVTGEDIEGDERLCWCPLVPMPERMEVMTLKEALKNTFRYGAFCGWNACIDAIEGGSHGKHN